MRIELFLFGYGIGNILVGLINLVFSSKKLTRKLDPQMGEYSVEESCRLNLIKGIVFFASGLIMIIACFVITYIKFHTFNFWCV